MPQSHACSGGFNARPRALSTRRALTPALLTSGVPSSQRCPGGRSFHPLAHHLSLHPLRNILCTAPPAPALPPSPPRRRAACVPSHPPARPAARWVGGCRADEGPPTYFTQPDVAAGPGVAMVRRIVYTDAPRLVLHSCSCCSERGSKAHLVLYLKTLVGGLFKR